MPWALADAIVEAPNNANRSNKMMTRQDAIEFAESSARAAFDMQDDFGGLECSIDSYRDNIRDTLNDERSVEHEEAAWAAFDAKVTVLRAA